MKYSIFSTLSALVVLSIILLRTPLASMFLAIVSFIGFLLIGSVLTKGLLSKYKDLSLPAFLAIISIIFSSYYYLMPVSSLGFLLIGFFILIVLYLLNKRFGGELDLKIKKPSYETLISFSLLGIFYAYLEPFGFSEAVRSPFDQVPVASLFLVSLIAIISTYSIIKKGAFMTGIALLFAGTGIASVVYKLGYGFDPFIHRATLEHIAEFGTITPKPLYYTGEYVIELFANLAFKVPLFELNVFLIPIISAIFIYIGGRHFIMASKMPSISFLGFLIIPFGAFLSTTPQALAYLYSLFPLILLFEENKNKEGALLSALFSLGAMLAHPLAGAPAFLATALYTAFYFKNSNARNWLIATITTLGCVSLPAMFTLQSIISGNSVTLNFQSADINIPVVSRLFSPSLDLLYGSYFFLPIILTLSFLLFSIKNKSEYRWPAMLMMLILIANYLIMKYFMQFDFLIDYERQNYTDRIVILMWLLALPGLAFTLSYFRSALNKNTLSTVFIFTILVTGLIYSSYPQDDGFKRSSGFNVSEYDIQAVQSIALSNEDLNYAVLSNQSVAGASLQEFGFAKYYDGDIFYYPIPTGGELYQLYLKMAEEYTSRSTINEVFELIPEIQKVYFVLNDYWWDADAISERAKKEADSWYAIGPNSEVSVFIFHR